MKKPGLHSIKKTFTQEADCCDSKDWQQLTISTDCSDDPRTGSFLIIETERWAIDPGDIDAFCKMLRDTLKEVTQ